MNYTPIYFVVVHNSNVSLGVITLEEIKSLFSLKEVPIKRQLAIEVLRD